MDARALSGLTDVPIASRLPRVHAPIAMDMSSSKEYSILSLFESIVVSRWFPPRHEGSNESPPAFGTEIYTDSPRNEGSEARKDHDRTENDAYVEGDTVIG